MLGVIVLIGIYLVVSVARGQYTQSLLSRSYQQYCNNQSKDVNDIEVYSERTKYAVKAFCQDESFSPYYNQAFKDYLKANVQSMDDLE